MAILIYCITHTGDWYIINYVKLFIRSAIEKDHGELVRNRRKLYDLKDGVLLKEFTSVMESSWRWEKVEEERYNAINEQNAMDQHTARLIIAFLGIIILLLGVVILVSG